MIKFKLNGKALEIPSSWDEVTFNQYKGILDGANDEKAVISLFTGIDGQTIKNAVIVGFSGLIKALSFLNAPANFPGVVNQCGKYKLPLNSKGVFDIQFESLGQFEDMRTLIKPIKDIQGLTDAYPKFVAIYLQKIRDKEYDYDKAMQMVDEIKAMPAKEVIVLGGYFFVHINSLLNGTKASSPTTTQSRKKSKQALTNSKKHSGSMRQSIKSRRK